MEEEFGLGLTIDVPFEQAVMRTRISLRAHGFSILSEMPAPASIGGAGRQHLFMCVWEQLISADNLGGQGLDVGDHLGVNVVVFEEEGESTIAALDPAEGLEGWSSAAGAEEARNALESALERVATG